MDRYAIIRDDTECVNVILWDGVADYQPPAGNKLVLLTDEFVVGPGWKKVDDAWQPPPLTPEEIAQREADAAAAAAAEAERLAEEEAKAAAKASALAKLEALGLTADEASALLGI